MEEKSLEENLIVNRAFHTTAGFFVGLSTGYLWDKPLIGPMQIPVEIGIVYLFFNLAYTAFYIKDGKKEAFRANRKSVPYAAVSYGIARGLVELLS